MKTDFGELPEVECYPQMLNQVFLNLLVNAGQAIEGEGTIVVRTPARRTASFTSRSADTGRGMTPEQKAKAFQAGFTTKPVGEGTGPGPFDRAERSSKTSTGARSISKASRAWARRFTSASP